MTTLALLLFLVPLAAFGPAERVAPTRWAVIVGISDYINFPDAEGGDLPGAENDARAMRDVLMARWGFAEENIRLLLNRDATRAAIEKELTEDLPARVRPGDHVLFFFAGHGSQMWDTNGDEEDGLDETIAPADVDPATTEFDISDDELGEWLRALPTRNVVYAHDNCNAGTGTRDVTPFSRARRLGRDMSDVARPAGASAMRALPGQEDESGFDLDDVEVLELAAAQPHQAAVDAYFPSEGDAEAFHGGAFSTFLVRHLWRAPASSTYEDVFRSVREELKRNRFQQDPHLTDESTMKSAPLFFVEGGEGAASGASFPVASVQGARAELTAGTAAGITTGSVFETDGAARLVVEEVTSGHTVARVASGSVRPGAQARMVAYRYPSSTLRVNVAGVDTETAGAVERALGASSNVELVRSGDAYGDLLLRRRGTEIRIVGADGFQRHDRPFLAGGAAGEEIATRLKAEAAAKRLGDMENPGQEFGVEIRLEGGQTTFGLGDRISFHVTSEREGYLTLVDLGTDGTINVLFPNYLEPDAVKLGAGQTYTFPSAAMGVEIVAQPPAGRGMVRAFVTPEPLDLPLASDDFVSGDVLLADRIAEAVKRAAGAVPGAAGAVRLAGWGSAALVYDITN